MVSYEEFKKNFLEQAKVQAEKEGWDSICCSAPSRAKILGLGEKSIMIWLVKLELMEI